MQTNHCTEYKEYLKLGDLALHGSPKPAKLPAQ